ncbi:MAG: 23S rRNA (pseudouridine(1915)-N(3))-methyltransferase RlmH [Firmicutes bacterium]|nr:23S rRNA (pseudouridine(1915)-N(3))-methyltransferase RlmH [Bacillota bacterium]
MQFKLICVGKIKEKYLKEGIDEYLKRLSAFVKTDVIEVLEEKSTGQISESDITKVIDAEGIKIIEKIPNGSIVVTLEIEKELLSSVELADWINQTSIYHSSQICFIIGGSYGLSDEVKKRADNAISFSKMTFPHQLMRLILLEQLYRSITLLNHITYHK